MLFADADPGMSGSEIALIITATCGGIATLITAVGSVIAAIYLVRVKLLAEQTAEKLATNTAMTEAIAVQQVQTKNAVVGIQAEASVAIQNATGAVQDVKTAVAQVAAHQVLTHQAIADMAAKM
jgi:hypothetical protein